MVAKTMSVEAKTAEATRVSATVKRTEIALEI
jgi:hypothetical protein